MVDQMRADAVDRFKGDWSAGLKRLVTTGAWFRRAAYPYLTTVTCAGHATVSGGTFHTHGVFRNAWWDRDAHRVMTCTGRPQRQGRRFTTRRSSGGNRGQMLVELRGRNAGQRSARVVTLALKDRAPSCSQATDADATTWLATLDGWETSPALTGQSRRGQGVQRRQPAGRGLRQSVVSSDADSEVSRSRRLAEAPPTGWTATFPRAPGSSGKPTVVSTRNGRPARTRGAYVGRFARALVESLQLGKHSGIDVPRHQFSAPIWSVMRSDPRRPGSAGHVRAPRSDDWHAARSAGRARGPGRVRGGLTSDHGVTPILNSS